MCCVRAGHVVADVAARRHMIRPEERVSIIPVVVDRSDNSSFFTLLRLVLLECSSVWARLVCIDR